MAGASSAGESTGGSSSAGEAGAFSEAGTLGSAGEAGASGAAGEAGASGVCSPGESRSCREDGALGSCALGMELCLGPAWSACSVQAAAADTCEANNDANCNGIANDGCSCVNGVSTKPCGACNDGIQRCTDGKNDQYGACQGALLTPKTYYRDEDGDGFGSATTTVNCGAAPSGYTDKPGDCCDNGGNLALAKSIFPGQTAYFTSKANLCGIDWNYDCSANNSIETQIPQHLTSCSSPGVACSNGGYTNYDSSSCGALLFTNCVCNTIGGANTCNVYCTGTQEQQACH